MRNDSKPATEGRRRFNPFKRFREDRKGSVAIEFTMLAIPFAMLIFAILESCISFAAQQVIANATDDIGRQLRTGQIRRTDVTEQTLKKMVCDRIDIVMPSGCPDLLVDLREFNSFSDAAKERIKLTASGDIDTTGFAVKPGPSMSKNMLRIFYRWPVITDFMRKSMSNLPNGKTLLFSTATWQNEPFDD